MKKVVYGFLAVAMVFLLTGCGKTVLTCKMSGNGANLDYVMEFKNNVIKNMTITYNIDLTGKSSTIVEAAKKQYSCESLKSALSQYQEGFENCNQKVDGNTLIVSTNINPDKVTNNVFEKMGSIEDTKKSLEDFGYSCSY